MQEAIESMVGEYFGKYLPESLARAAIVEVGRRTFARGFVAANDGNISARIGDDVILATPTGRSKGFIREDELVKINLAGEKLEGPLRPSSEILMHLAIYKTRPDVLAIDHAHPPICTGFAVAGIPLDKCVLAEVVMTLGVIPIAEFAPPSTDELAEAVAAKMKDCNAVLLANHGAVSVGKDVFEAHYTMERIEHFANISLVARLLGGEKLLTANDIERISEVQREAGAKMPTVACKIGPDGSASCGLGSDSASPQGSSASITGSSVKGDVSGELVAEVLAAIKREFAEI